MRALEENTPEGRLALDILCQRYWFPLYAFARKKGYSPQDSEDLTQGFLARFIERGSLANADPGKGRLRAYLQASMGFYITDQWRRETTLAKGSGSAVVKGLSIDQAEQILSEDSAFVSRMESPDETFDRRWALAVLDRVLERLREHYDNKGEGDVLDQIKPFLEGSRHHDETYEECARALGITANVVRVRTTRLRRRFRKLLIEEVAATVPESEVEDELRFLFSVFQKPRSR